MEIGDRIRAKREALGMSQEELATKIGYKSRSSINKIEKDGRGLPQSKILLIARALETTPDFLLGWSDDETDFYPDVSYCFTCDFEFGFCLKFVVDRSSSIYFSNL